MVSTVNNILTAEKGRAASVSVDPAAPTALPALESHPAWPAISRFPVLLAVSVPLRGLRIRDLLELRPGRLIDTSWDPLDDVPLSTGPLQLAWGEFDVLNDSIALRLTRLA